MVKISTLFHRVDGFDEQNASSTIPVLLDPGLEDQYLENLLRPLNFDPGEDLVKSILEKI
ncbi:MAG: hypothetical protein P1P86_09560 [Bacteroidales bacterium]|nr:hypothetical protein [Bacteroidales bacterium]